MKRLFLSAACLFMIEASVTAGPLRVLVWDEQQPEQKKAYGEKFLGETIAAGLGEKEDFKVRSASLEDPEQGLEEAVLADTDVLVWWGHRQHQRVSPAKAEQIVQRVKEGKLALIALHSAHWARPFVRLMQERAKEDALKQVPEPDRATVRIEFSNESPIGHGVRPGSPLTPALSKKDGIWQLSLPSCVFPAWRADGAPGHMKTLLPGHSIAAGLPAEWVVAQTEMYSEPFHVPDPDSVIFEERWDKGEFFRSGSLWKVGRGQVFYFRPGHETYPVYLQKEPMQVLENAVRYLGRSLAPGKGGEAAR